MPKTGNLILRPVAHLSAAGRLYPRAWRQADDLRAQRGRGLPEWPGWCFLPIAGWYAIVSGGGDNRLFPGRQVADVGRLAALGAWRYGQGIYRFHPALFAELVKTDLTGDLPGEVLLRLPEWCGYIETPGLALWGEPLHGFFVHLEHDANNGRVELRLLLDLESMLSPLPLHIGPWPLAEAVNRMLIESTTQAVLSGIVAPVPPNSVAGDIAGKIMPLLSLLLYLCSDGPDIGEKGEPGPSRPKIVRTQKHGYRAFPAQQPRVWPVGAELGAALERAETEALNGRERSDLERAETERNSPRPHLRRAHWHGFWSGPKDGARRYRYKWLPPILVAFGGEDE